MESRSESQDAFAQHGPSQGYKNFEKCNKEIDSVASCRMNEFIRTPDRDFSSVNLIYSPESDAIIDEDQEIIMSIVSRTRERELSTLVRWKSDFIRVLVRSSKIDVEGTKRLGWTVFRMSLPSHEADLPDIRMRVVECLKAYGYINGMGSKDNIPIEFNTDQ